jgi:hypothetical protein
VDAELATLSVAVLLELARRTDENPRVALALRGFTTATADPDATRVPLTLLDPATFYGQERPPEGAAAWVLARAK